MKHRLALLAALIMLLAPRVASAATILQFQQVIPFGQPWDITAVGGTTTISTQDLLVTANLNPAFCLEPTCGGLPLAGGVYLLDFSATSTGAAVLSVNGQDILQPYAGTMSFTGTGAFAGVNLLTFSFSDQLTGGVGSGNPTIAAGDPPDLFFNATSSILDPNKLGPPRGFSIGFSDWEGGFTRNGTTVASSMADAAGTLDATPFQVNVVPEPASLVLMGTGLAALAGKYRRRRKDQ